MARRFSGDHDSIKADGRARSVATAKHIEVLIDSGIKGLVMAGSLGENQTMLPEEKRQLVKHAVEVAGKRIPC